jgi:precorrin-2 methylase
VKIRLVGYGLWPERHLTLEGIDALKSCDHIFCLGHSESIYNFLRRRRLRYADLREQYRLNGSRSAIYRAIAERVLTDSRRYESVAYLTYGHPLFFESPSRNILRLARKLDVQTEVFPGISFLDAFLADHQISVDSNGYIVITAEECIKNLTKLDVGTPVILAQLGVLGHRKARPQVQRLPFEYNEIIKYLNSCYPAAHPALLFDTNSAENGFVTEWIRLGELASLAHLFSYTTSLYIPAVASRSRLHPKLTMKSKPVPVIAQKPRK